MVSGSLSSWPDATAVVNGRGAVRDRPAGTISGNTELVARLSAFARTRSDSPLSFLWIGPTRNSDRPSRSVLRVVAEPDPGAVDECTVQLRWVPQDDVAGLTERELETLTLVACGLTNAQIATRLSVSRRTIATHVERILAKVGASSRAGAAAIARDRDLLVLPLEGTDLDALGSLEVVQVESRARIPALPIAHRSGILRRRPLTIGAIYPSGPEWARDGQAMRRGAGLALEEVNAHGGVAGRQLQLVPEQADVTRAESVGRAIELLVDQDVDAITIGYLLDRSSGAFAAQFAKAAEAGCPVLHHSTSAAATALVVEEPGVYGNIFQMCAPTSAYGAGFVRTVSALRDSGAWRPTSRRLLVLDAVDPDLATFSESTAAAAERAGWHPVVEPLGMQRPGWAAVLDRVHALDPAAVLITCFSAGDLAAFVSAFDARPTGALLYALYAPSVPSFLESVGAAAEGLLWATVTGVYADDIGLRFGRRFRERFGAPAGLSSAGIHHDMVQLLAEGWARSTSPRDFHDVNAVLRRSLHRGVNGSYQLDSPAQTVRLYPDETPDPSIGQAHLVFQVQQGRHQIIAPTPYTTASFSPPRLRG
jgi:branched-chain amino acid transport system substrate-binding protein